MVNFKVKEKHLEYLFVCVGEEGLAGETLHEDECLDEGEGEPLLEVELLSQLVMHVHGQHLILTVAERTHLAIQH
jgi:hypothetical protein